jgi:hypothetical protein
VSDHDDRETVRAIHIEQEISELRCVHPVQCTGRFVGEQELRLIDERTSDGGALAFAPGELTGSMVRTVPEPDGVQQFLGALLSLGAIGARLGQRGHENVFEHRALGQQVVKLEDESDRFIAELRETSFVEFAKVLTSDPHLSTIGAIERANYVQQGALAATGRSEDRHRLAGINLEVEVVQYFNGIGPVGRTVGFREV